MKVKAKREPRINEFEQDDHGEEEQDRTDESNSGRVPEIDEEKRVVHAGCVSHVQAIKEKHAKEVRDFVQAEQGKGNDDELRLGIGELYTTSSGPRKESLLRRRTESFIELLRR